MPNTLSAAETAALDVLRTRAQHTLTQLLKTRARAYIRAPMTLENIHPGLAAASPDTMIAIAEHLLDTERSSPRRWFGWGGEVPAANARAVLLLGRTLRRKTVREQAARSQTIRD